ncbi:MAG TPA: protease pro-enzyme activation domain-containing protein [Bryobacteraceae bacterium]|jgi:subtilase family serine protease
MNRPAGAPLTWADLRKLLFFAALLSILCLFPKSVKGQAGDRIREPINEEMRVRRAGTHPFVRPEFDAGRVEAETPLERMILVLQPDAAQSQELEELLAAQQNSASPLFHQWLTPEDFGRRFGLSDHDLNQVVRWLQDHGFTIESVAGGGRQIVFSGTASQVENAFRTEIHEYRINGVVYHANARDVEIPAALAPVVSGIVSLHDFHSRPMHARIAPASSVPDYTAGGGVHYVAPGDFATIYNLWPLYGSSTTGSGQSIAVVARSNLKLDDVQGFRSKYALPPNTPNVIVNGKDPGVSSSDEQGEVTLDAEWAGAVAQSASIQVVVSASTQTTDGVALSAQYIVNHNLAPIVTVSFGGCESAMGRSANQFWNGLWQQAAAQGMSVFVASGDAGAAECDDASATTGTSADVNGLCSSPYSTCVGGTQFDDTATPGAYWLSSNSSTRGSATGYIPEIAWNESASGTGLWASGGGASHTYSKPSWQTGPGVPADGHRDVPDVSLASAAHDGYLFNLNGQSYSASGTSVATPSFAGLMALIDGRQGGRQGNANPSLYTLATNQAKGGSTVFHDIASGNNSVPGVTGYTAGHGYDLVTGLGSVDANLLVNAWGNGNAPPPAPCTYSLSAGNAAPDATAQGLTVVLTASSPSCSWTAGSDSTWIVITSGASGTGTQTVTYSVSANPSSLARTGTLTIAGLALTVTQAGTSCIYSVRAGSLRLPAGGFNGSVAVASPAGCGWTATTDVSWLRINSGASGNGTGAVTFTALPNAGGTRRGTLVVAGYTLKVTQQARSRIGIAMMPEPATSLE